MKIQTINGVLELNQELFWDIDLKRVPLVVEQNPYWTLPRVFECGTLQEIADIIDYYGEEQSKRVIVEQKSELKPMAKAMAHVYLDVELRDYRET